MTFWNSKSLQPSKQNRFRVVFTPSTPMREELDALFKSSRNAAASRAIAAAPSAGSIAASGGGGRQLAINAADRGAATVAETTDFWWWVKSCTLPSYEIAMSEYQLVNHKFKYPGMLVWNDVTITMVDASNNMELLQKMLGLAGYGEGPACDSSGISKAAFAAQGDFRIQVIDADGQTKKQWHLKGWFIRSARYGDLNYESDDLLTMELTLGYDYAVLENRTGDTILKEASAQKLKTASPWETAGGSSALTSQTSITADAVTGLANTGAKAGQTTITDTEIFNK